MPVPSCTICSDLNATPSQADLDSGDYCPVCHRPTCHRHLTTVRFKWRETSQVDSAKICRNCKTTYQHRYWDSARRDWIS
jgi:hypothetical protein